MFDSIIIGGGPAGLAAALYLARKKINFLLISTDLGGQAAKASSVENYPGVDKLSGAELSEKFSNQLQDLKVEIKNETVKSMEKIDGGFKVTTGDQSYDSRSIIICSGKTHRKLGVNGEEEFAGKGVSYCATCDGPLFQDKVVAIVGGGNSALDSAIGIEKYAKEVIILNLSPEIQGDAIMVDKFKKSPKGKIILNAKTTEIYGDQTVKGLKYEDQTTKEVKDLPCDGIFVEIGWTPSADFCKDLVELNQLGEIVVDKFGATEIPGIFACGDVTDTPFKQIVIASGEGAKVALSAWKWLITKSH